MELLTGHQGEEVLVVGVWLELLTLIHSRWKLGGRLVGCLASVRLQLWCWCLYVVGAGHRTTALRVPRSVRCLPAGRRLVCSTVRSRSSELFWRNCSHPGDAAALRVDTFRSSCWEMGLRESPMRGSEAMGVLIPELCPGPAASWRLLFA